MKLVLPRHHLVVGVAGFIVSVALTMVLTASNVVPALLLPIIGLGIALLFWTGRAVRRPARRRDVHVVVDEQGLHVDGKLALRREEAQGGRVVPHQGAPPTVQLFKGRRVAVEIEAASDDEARELLEAMELDAARKKAVFRCLNPRLPPARVQVGAILAMGLMATGGAALAASSRLVSIVPVMLVLTWLMFMAIPTLLTPARCEVGTDGVLVRWLTGRRFLSFADITGVDAHPRGVVLALRSGEPYIIPLAARKQVTLTEITEQGALVQRIKDGLAAYGAQAPIDVTALVGRGTRDVKSWLDALRALAKETSYRASAVPEDQLWRVVESSTSEPTARVGAAMLLRKNEGAKERLRVAAEASASPRLRVALEAAASEDEEDAVAARLEEL